MSARGDERVAGAPEEAPERAPEPRRLRGTGRGTRAGIALQVGLSAALALAALAGVTWLAGRPGVRARVDLTATGSNTLDPALAEVVEALEEPVTIDVFFRAVEPPYTQVIGEVQARAFEIALLMEQSSFGKVDLVRHVLDSDRARAGVEARLRELPGAAPNTMVVSTAERTEVLHVRGDLAEIDAGNLDPNAFRPPSVRSMRAEQALLEALLAVTRGQRVKVRFAFGHGEPDLYGDAPHEYGALQRLLVDSGFEPGWWRGEEDGPLEDDVRVLAILGPLEPFTEQETAWVHEFLRAGGRLVAAPAAAVAPPEDPSAAPGTLAGIVARYGMTLLPGFVARPLVGPSGQIVFGRPECAQLVLGPDVMAVRHPVTEPLRRADRRVVLPFARAIERGRSPFEDGVLLPVLFTNDLFWRDLPDARGLQDWEFAEGVEPQGPFEVALSSIFPPPDEVPSARSLGMQTRPESRVLVVGSAQVFDNSWLPHDRDFAVNAFEWAASREFRVRVASRAEQRRVLPIDEGRALFHLNLAATWGLPALCLAAALLAAFLRRRA